MQHAAVWHLYLLLSIYIKIFFVASVHSFFTILKKYDIDKWTEWSKIPACPSPMCFKKNFLTGAMRKGIFFENFVFDICVRMFCFEWNCVRTDFVDFGKFVV